MLEERRGRWRVVVEPDVEEFFEERGFLGDCKRHVEELEKNLNRDPWASLRLFDPTEHPVLGCVELPGLGVMKVRRYRIYLRSQAFRLAFTIYRIRRRGGISVRGALYRG